MTRPFYFFRSRVRYLVALVMMAMSFIFVSNIVLWRHHELAHGKHHDELPTTPPRRRQEQDNQNHANKDVAANMKIPTFTVAPRTSAPLTAAPTRKPTEAPHRTPLPLARDQIYLETRDFGTKSHPGGTEREALQERRRLSKLNWPLKSWRDARWTSGERPTVSNELVMVQEELGPGESTTFERAEAACRGRTDNWYCLLTLYDTESKYRTKTSKFCDDIYGKGFIDKLRSKSHTHSMCERPSEGGTRTSQVVCHNVRVDSHDIDTAACIADNPVISYDDMLNGDFPWLAFQKGAFTLKGCRTPPSAQAHWQFMHSLADWMNLGYRTEGGAADNDACDVYVNDTTLFVTRSGDYSPFAMTHDFLNTIIPMLVDGTRVRADHVRVVLMDRMTVGFYAPVWQLLFSSPTQQVEWFPDLREQHKNKRVCYRKALFNIPARLSMLYNNHHQCLRHGGGGPESPPATILALYRDLVLNSVGALRTVPWRGGGGGTDMPLVVTIINRRNYKTGHPIGRRIANVEDLAKMITKSAPPSTKVFVDVVDYAVYQLDQQLNISRATDFLVGMHGAGLIHAMFVPRHASVFEFFCPEKPPSNYRYNVLSGLLGLDYHSYNIVDADNTIPIGEVSETFKSILSTLRKRKLAAFSSDRSY
eukprot:PhM_4_TR7361/c0_g1_i1/m.31548/K18134/EOGT; protein O-GlcNAc transferase